MLGMENNNTALKQAVAAAGTQQRLATALGVRQSCVSNWLVRGVPPERCLHIEKVTGVSRYDLRPDVFGEAPRRRARA